MAHRMSIRAPIQKKITRKKSNSRAYPVSEKLLRFQDLKLGVQEAFLNIADLYPHQSEREKFEERLLRFLNSDSANLKIFRRKDELLIYRTECIVPEKQDSRFPLLLLFGNPASHSVYSEMFFSFESNGREHRFWKVLNKVRLLSFTSDLESGSRMDLAYRNRLRKEELYDLRYNSPFRIGLAVFYSMPSGASGTGWAGVAGLYRLFGKRALWRIGEYEKSRVERLIRKFVSPRGAIIAFQKDAYLRVKSSMSPDYDIARARSGELVGVCQCDPDVRLFCFPPTRLMQGRKMLALLRHFKESASKMIESSFGGEINANQG